MLTAGIQPDEHAPLRYAGSIIAMRRLSLRGIGRLGGMIAVRCPREFAPLMRQAGGQWEPGSRQWLIERRRIGPVIRTLRATTDPLFRRAGMTLDEG